MESELGLIPEGWDIISFGEIADILSGGTPKTTESSYWGGNIPFFSPKEATDFFYVSSTESFINELGLSKCNSRLFPKNTVFITARGTVGKVVMPSIDMAMNQSCYALIGQKGITQFFLFLLTRQSSEYFKKNTGGATFSTIVIDTFIRYKICKPPNEIINRFTVIIEPFFTTIEGLLNINLNLRKTRDLLLPRLISGELDVSDLHISLPDLNENT